MNLDLIFKMPGVKRQLTEMVNNRIKPMIMTKKAQYMSELTSSEIDVSIIIRSKDDFLFYFITAINEDHTPGRILAQGNIDEIISL